MRIKPNTHWPHVVQMDLPLTQQPPVKDGPKSEKLKYKTVKMWSTRVSLITLILFTPYPGVSGCNPGDLPPSVEEKVEYAMVVVQGTVTEHYPGRRIVDGQYIASFKVQCVFKDAGKRVPEILNITNGEELELEKEIALRNGPNPGQCFTAQLDVNESFVVFLRDLDTRYKSNAQEIRLSDTAKVTRVTSTCGLKVTDIYPQGITEATSKTKCPKIVNKPCPSTTPYVPTKRTKPPPKPRVTTTKPMSTVDTKPVKTTPSIAYTTVETTKKFGVATETGFTEGSASESRMIHSHILILTAIGAWLAV